MSMLSRQTERLRALANLFEGFGYENFAREIRDAADTIDNLRMQLQETCRNIADDSVEDLVVWFECSECGIRCPEQSYMHFCPNCGRRVIA